jgi:hypothetical protein
MNTLSIQRPLPSIETLMSAPVSTARKRGLVNWLPWSVLTHQLEVQRALPGWPVVEARPADRHR